MTTKTFALLALVSLAACSSSGEGLASATDADGPSRGRQNGTAVGTSTPARDALTSADAGRAGDAEIVVVADSLALDTLPAVLPDGGARPDSVAQLHPDALVVPPDSRVVPDTRVEPDSRLAPVCRWSNKASGQVADVYLAEGAARCGGYLTMSCFVGCVAMSIAGGATIEKLTPPRQSFDSPSAGCRAQFMPPDAGLEIPGLCFPDSESCAKACQ
jgi:hypothetical protein